MVKGRSDNIKDDSLVKVEKRMNVQNKNDFSDKSYQMKKYDSLSETTKKIEKDTLETESCYKRNTEMVGTTNKQMASDTQDFDESGYKVVKRKADGKNQKEILTKYDSKDFTHNERLKSSKNTVQRHSQKSTSDEKPTSCESSKTVDSNRNKKNSKIAHQKRNDESNANGSIRQNHTNCGEQYVEQTLDETTNKLNFKEYERSVKRDNKQKKLNIKTSPKYSFEKSCRNDNPKCNGEMSTTCQYTESLKQAKDASCLITRMKEQNIQINTKTDEVKAVSISEQLTSENEMSSNHRKTLIDECINQTHFQAQYVEETPLNTKLDIQIKEATSSRVKEQLTLTGTANRIDEVKDYTETYAIPGHDGSTQRANEARINNFEHASVYDWHDNSYLPYRPVMAYPLDPDAPVFTPRFNGNTSSYNQDLDNGGQINEYPRNEFPNIQSWDQLTYQPTYFEQSAEYLTNLQNLIYHSENLNSGYCQLPIECNGMVYYQYYPDFFSLMFMFLRKVLEVLILLQSTMH